MPVLQEKHDLIDCSNDGDQCFIQQPSVCGADDAVSCSNLQDDDTPACCPSGTSCDPNFPANKTMVKCLNSFNNLLNQDEKNYSASTSTMSSSAAAATSTAPATSNTSTNNSSLSGGAIAGIVVGCIIALGLIVAAVTIGLRRHYHRRYIKRQQTLREENSNPIEAHPEAPPTYEKYIPRLDPSNDQYYSPTSVPQELRGTEPSELDAHTEPEPSPAAHSPVSPYSSVGGLGSPKSPRLSP